MQRALFVDRDGTIIHDAGYPRDPEVVSPIPGAAAALRRAQELGYAIVIVSNQSGVARGLIQPAEARAVQERVARVFAREGVVFAGAFFCFHGADEGCACRKPKPGLLLEAARTLALDLPASIMIGDKPADVEAGLAAGATAIAFGARAAADRAATALATWDEVGRWIASRERG